MKVARACLLASLTGWLAAACHGQKQESLASAGESTGRGRMQAGLYYVEPGAPDPLACRSDDDCTADVVTSQGGCCPVNNPYAQTKAWRAWLQRHRNASCAGADCSDAMRMAPPPSCAFNVGCRAEKCQDACGSAPP